MRRLVLLALVVAACAGCGGSGTSVPDGPVTPVAHWVKAERLPAEAVPGAKIFSVAGCLGCHVYAGSGKQVLDAPDLTAVGVRRNGIAFEIAQLKCPACVHPGSPMPSFASLGRKRLRALAVFLEASKGTR
jgi:hypothetical protein